MTTDKKLIEHETRISRMEGIIEEIRTRLTGMEAGQRELGRKIDSVKHTILVGLLLSPACCRRWRSLIDASRYTSIKTRIETRPSGDSSGPVGGQRRLRFVRE